MQKYFYSAMKSQWVYIFTYLNRWSIEYIFLIKTGIYLLQTDLVIITLTKSINNINLTALFYLEWNQ